jgi:hypothetical protein
MKRIFNKPSSNKSMNIKEMREDLFVIKLEYGLSAM